MPRRLGIRSQLLGLVAAAAVPFLVLIGVALWNQYRTAQTESLERAYSEARVIAAQIDDHLGNLENLSSGAEPRHRRHACRHGGERRAAVRTEGAAARLHIRHRRRRAPMARTSASASGARYNIAPTATISSRPSPASRSRSAIPCAIGAHGEWVLPDRASDQERRRRSSSGPPHRHADLEIPGRDPRRPSARGQHRAESSTTKASSSPPFRRCPTWSVAICRTWTPSSGICRPRRPVKSRPGATRCPASPATRPRIARRGW